MRSWGEIARRIRVPLGFASAVVYLWLAQPTWRSLIFGAVICVPGLTLRAIASGHVQKNTRLTTSGPYAFTRNPLYLGSLMLAAGFAMAARSLWVGLLLLALFVVVYLPVVRQEEDFLRLRFPEFADYAQRVPRFFPRWAPNEARQGQFSAQLYWKHREYNALVGTGVMIAALAAKLLVLR